MCSSCPCQRGGADIFLDWLYNHTKALPILPTTYISFFRQPNRHSNSGSYRSTSMIYFQSNLDFLLRIYFSSAPFGSLMKSNFYPPPVCLIVYRGFSICFRIFLSNSPIPTAITVAKINPLILIAKLYLSFKKPFSCKTINTFSCTK